MKQKLVYPFKGLLDALKEKDADLYYELCHLTPDLFWQQWKRVHPEDFPLGAMSPASAASVVL